MTFIWQCRACERSHDTDRRPDFRRKCFTCGERMTLSWLVSCGAFSLRVEPSWE